MRIFHAPVEYRSHIKNKSRPIWSQLHTGTIFDPIIFVIKVELDTVKSPDLPSISIHFTETSPVGIFRYSAM